MNQKVIYAVVGRIGAGKTTYARKLAQEKKAILFSMDQTLACMGALIKSYKDYQLFYPGMSKIMRDTAEQALALGVPVIFDYGVNRPKGRISLKEFAKKNQARLEIHHLVVPLEECRRRVHERNRTKPAGIFAFEFTDEEFDFISQNYIPPTEDEKLDVVTVEWKA